MNIRTVKILAQPLLIICTGFSLALLLHFVLKTDAANQHQNINGQSEMQLKVLEAPVLISPGFYSVKVETFVGLNQKQTYINAITKNPEIIPGQKVKVRYHELDSTAVQPSFIWVVIPQEKITFVPFWDPVNAVFPKRTKRSF